MAGKCGTCTACCRVFSIPKLDKPAGKWCEHCAIGVGCKIYDNRPDTCIDFKCMWLESFEHGFGFTEEMRPDRCKVVFGATTNPFIISATTMHAADDSWRKGPARVIIDQIISSGMRVVVGSPTSLTKIMVDKSGEYEVEMTEPDENGIQWNRRKHYERMR